MTIIEQNVSAPAKPGTAILALSTPPPPKVVEVDATLTLLAFALVLVIVLAVRKLGPWLGPFLARVCDPWGLGLPSQNEPAAKGKSLAEFVAGLNSSPPGPQPANPTANPNGTPAPANDGVQSPPGEPADPIEEFFHTAPALLESFRASVCQLGRIADEPGAQKQLADFLKNVRTLKEKAGLASLPVWLIACLLEGLLKLIAEKPERATPTTVRTIVGAVDLLPSLCARGIPPDLLHAPAVRLMAVDDDPISLRALAHTLKKSVAEPDQAGDGHAAILLAQTYSYDAIFLDIAMPGLNGFDACAGIRSTAGNQTTPVVFVTSRNDLEARARSLLVGAHDLLSKPFLAPELGLKALTVVLRRRLQSAPQTSPASATSPRAAAPPMPAPVASIHAGRPSASVAEPAHA